MKLRNEIHTSLQHQLLTTDECDDGMEPLKGTRRTLDFTIGNDGALYPKVTLERAGHQSHVITFKQGLRPEEISRTGTLRSEIRRAAIHFAQEDPSNPEVYVLVSLGDIFLEQLEVSPVLDEFIQQMLEVGENPPGPEEFGEAA
ncbi:MAG: hypothetical protein KW802_00380 [Candidatus Doudnabacteria bacterium]|nr:hypothetical protein [Candidatus Doudnabacteria bacterium]